MQIQINKDFNDYCNKTSFINLEPFTPDTILFAIGDAIEQVKSLQLGNYNYEPEKGIISKRAKAIFNLVAHELTMQLRGLENPSMTATTIAYQGKSKSYASTNQTATANYYNTTSYGQTYLRETQKARILGATIGAAGL